MAMVDTVPVSSLSRRSGSPSTDRTIRLDVVSDPICPWCYIAKRRLAQVTTILGAAGVVVAVRWRPLQLNPTMVKGGMNRQQYRAAKFGSWQRSRELDAEVAAVGNREGIGFRFDLIERTPNTFDAHRLIWLAGQEGASVMQDAVVEAIFAAYFVRGLDIGNRSTLAHLATEAGLNRARAEALLSREEAGLEVAADEATARGRSVTGVPGFVLNGALIFSGALPSGRMAEALLAEAADIEGAAVINEGAPTGGGAA